MSISAFFEKAAKLSRKPQKVHLSYASNKGNVRTRNEDDLYIDALGSRARENMAGDRVLTSSDRYIFAVLDGMGGEQFGDEAAAIASNTIAAHSAKLNEVSPDELNNAVNELVTEANNRISGMVYEKHAILSGSTLVLAVLRSTMVYIFNLGDSRAYFCKNGQLTQITADHTAASREQTDGEKPSKDAHRLTSFLGIDDRWVGIQAQAYAPFDISGGILLLCSDGLYDMCSTEEITEILSGDISGCANRLVEKALEHGGHDNITCMVIQTINTK